ncbi:arf-GAP with Rho-GAP domain, ANK repeat and PH domain-containing protein 2 [Aricia agestis]|uniref:arf-GAP with Rho-GAP domain, ANK repeat and PH domain-containing protein 2 n=1 Tax=Aricia agestis TaxID=91739 RepID=UPI001C202361|nr:arf-GAP with Rho-GAP domain, ANK repeat and PH domain-containing protein 2 [Aricia agestis]
MDTPPIPKPRTTVITTDETTKKPVPLPRTKPPTNNDKVTATDILRSLSTVSKQITEDVAQKVTSSAKTANEKFEKTLNDGSRIAKGTFERTLTTSRAVRDSVTRSVIKNTKNASLKLGFTNKSSDSSESDKETQRPASMPVVDVSLFDNIQFHSPLLEQKRLNDQLAENNPSTQLNASHLDDVSIFSNNSDSNTDSVSNFSFDIRDNDHHDSNFNLKNEMTYDTPKASRTNSIASDISIPEVPSRRKKRASSFEVMRQNSLYENWNFPCSSSSHDLKCNIPESSRPSKSTIYEFDPLNKCTTEEKFNGISNENLLLEYFLVGDTYGTIVSNETSGDDHNYEFDEREYFNPPTPPERFDSLLFNDISVETPAKKNSCWYDDESTISDIDETKPSGSMIQRFSSMLKKDKVATKLNKQGVDKINLVERPAINILPVQYYSGMITKVVSGVVEDLFRNSQTRFCSLSDKKLMCYTDPTNSILKESYTLESITVVQIVLPLSSSTTNNSYCFELMVSNGVKSSPRKVLFSCASASERRNWAQKIAEHLMNGFPNKYTSEFTRCGWCYLKEGVSGEWRGAWLMLIRRVLVYSVDSEMTRNVDLRKTRCVVTRDPDDNTKNLCPSDGSPNLLLDCPDVTLYLRFQHERDLKGWMFMIKLAAHNNGAKIHHQQLTKNDVPTIVDKCINFIYSHGSLSDGIYRRAGSNVVLSELLAKFRRDAWSVQLIPGQHSEHDVAGVLKRFFRDLPESLLPQDQRAEFIAASDMKDAERRAEYKRLVTSQQLVVYNTMKKLFAHLHFIHTMSHANKMGAYNLAAIWAPTIMPAAVTSTNLQTAWSTKELNVVRDLIIDYESIWEPTKEELRREAAVRSILTRVMNTTAPTPPKAAGDLRVWVYINDKSNCYQIPLTPNKTCSDVCIELCKKANCESHLLTLEEVICNSMRRVIHVDEIVLDVVLRWGYWDEEDRKDNYLLLKENKILHELDALRHGTSLVCGELRYANESNKTFKQYMFEFKNGKLCYFKDKQGSHKVEEWHIKDILWYVGHEPKRNPQSRWSITFIPRNNKQKRSKDRPWFGTTIAGSVTEDQLKWMTAMMFAEHDNILPIPQLVVT